MSTAILGRQKMDFTEETVSQPSPDSATQYTSFESMRKMQRGDAKDTQITWRKVVINKDDCVMFFGRKHFLSNFFEAPMLIAGHMYATVEHYYEACKVYALAGPYQAMYLKGARDPGQVKAMSKKILQNVGKSRKDADLWKRTDGFLVMRVGLMEKFRQNPKLREQLLKTGDSLLVQVNQYDNLWSVGMDAVTFEPWLSENQGLELQVPTLIDEHTLGCVPDVAKGKNVLGFLMMYVRDCLRSEFGLAGGKVEAVHSKPCSEDQEM